MTDSRSILPRTDWGEKNGLLGTELVAGSWWIAWIISTSKNDHSASIFKGIRTTDNYSIKQMISRCIKEASRKLDATCLAIPISNTLMFHPDDWWAIQMTMILLFNSGGFKPSDVVYHLMVFRSSSYPEIIQAYSIIIQKCTEHLAQALHWAAKKDDRGCDSNDCGALRNLIWS